MSLSWVDWAPTPHAILFALAARRMPPPRIGFLFPWCVNESQWSFEATCGDGNASRSSNSTGWRSAVQWLMSLPERGVRAQVIFACCRFRPMYIARREATTRWSGKAWAWCVSRYPARPAGDCAIYGFRLSFAADTFQACRRAKSAQHSDSRTPFTWSHVIAGMQTRSRRNRSCRQSFAPPKRCTRSSAPAALNSPRSRMPTSSRRSLADLALRHGPRSTRS